MPQYFYATGGEAEVSMAPPDDTEDVVAALHLGRYPAEAHGRNGPYVAHSETGTRPPSVKHTFRSEGTGARWNCAWMRRPFSSSSVGPLVKSVEIG
jgi:hypothetical protein